MSTLTNLMNISIAFDSILLVLIWVVAAIVKGSSLTFQRKLASGSTYVSNKLEPTTVSMGILITLTVLLGYSIISVAIAKSKEKEDKPQLFSTLIGPLMMMLMSVFFVIEYFCAQGVLFPFKMSVVGVMMISSASVLTHFITSIV